MPGSAWVPRERFLGLTGASSRQEIFCKTRDDDSPDQSPQRLRVAMPQIGAENREGTVKLHRRNAMTKMGAKTLADLLWVAGHLGNLLSSRHPGTPAGLHQPESRHVSHRPRCL